MSLIITRNKPYEGSTNDRKAFSKYCNTKINYDLWYDHTDAVIDGFLKTPKGYSAIELAHNKCWGNQQYYPCNENICIPAGKLRHFCKVLEGCILKDEDTSNVVKVQRGYFIVFNTVYTRAVIMKFKDIFNTRSKVSMQILNGSTCEVVTVPHNILHYINIPTG